jgi:hypothetical protein
MSEAVMQLRQVLGVDAGPGEEIRKAYTAALGLTGINLEPAVKILLPIYNPIRRRLPVDRPQMGGQHAIYRALLGYASGARDSDFFGAAFGAVGPENQHNAVTFQIPYASLALNDRVQWEAIQMARAYDDAMATATQAALVRLLRAEEQVILGANRDAILAPSAPTLTGQSSGGSIGTGTVNVRVTALTYLGWRAGSTGGASAVGETDPSPQASVSFASGTTNSVLATWPAVKGAVAYNVYVNGFYYTTSFINRVVITSVPASGNAPPASNTTANANIFEGLISWATRDVIYGISVDKSGLFVDAGGAGLTAQPGGIKEFDDILANLWNRWQISPSLVVGSAAAVRNLTAKLMSLQNALQYRVAIEGERGGFTGGVILAGYINKFAASVEGLPAVIPVIAHPYMPDGMFLFLAERIPYPYSREGRGFALDVQTPYTYFPLARTDRSFPFSVFLTETLKCYMPAAQAALVCFDVNA